MLPAQVHSCGYRSKKPAWRNVLLHSRHQFFNSEAPDPCESHPVLMWGTRKFKKLAFPLWEASMTVLSKEAVSSVKSAQCLAISHNWSVNFFLISFSAYVWKIILPAIATSYLRIRWKCTTCCWTLSSSHAVIVLLLLVSRRHRGSVQASTYLPFLR